MDLIETARFDELCQALGTEQVLMLVDLLPASYQEERMRLIDAAANGDPEAIKRSGHAIKGMAKNMAAGRLSQEALALEAFDGDFADLRDVQFKKLDELVETTVAAMREMLAAR
jgi:HPt (histidine-containing phosphotransfer) domain-containing protein